MKNTCWVIEWSFLKGLALTLLDVYFLSLRFCIDILLVGEVKFLPLFERNKKMYIPCLSGEGSLPSDQECDENLQPKLVAALGGSCLGKSSIQSQ